MTPSTTTIILHFLITSLLFLTAHPSLDDNSVVAELFEAWCRQHNRTYSSPQQRLHRLAVFRDNFEFVRRHNSLANRSCSLGLNAFADLTLWEFRDSRLGLGLLAEGNGFRVNREGGGSPVSGVEAVVPSSMDWRDKGVVTPVKDQGSCGACWSFSATGAIEGINKIVTGSLVSLSEQELVDCDITSNEGCNGGLMNYAFQFVVKNHGIDTEDDYPYTGRGATCNKNKVKRRVVTIDGYVDVLANNEKQLLKAVAAQPVSVGICGSERAFQLYSKGIFDGPCSTALDHAVLIVGYDSKDGNDYWIVKNSWGSRWGMNGYIYMRRNTGNSQGICGINMMPSYPIKSHPNPPTPPSPRPTRCDLFTYCSEGETCCCALRVFGICLSWRCCELESGVCCEHNPCRCPHDHPTVMNDAEVAAFRATLEEISESSLLVHVVDISHPLAEQQIDAVDRVLADLDVSLIPKLMVWNKVDQANNPEEILSEAEKRVDVVCLSALTGEGLGEFCDAVQEKLKDSMVWIEALVPFDKGELLSTIHQVGMVEWTEYTEKGTMIKAYVPLRFARLLTPMRQLCIS